MCVHSLYCAKFGAFNPKATIQEPGPQNNRKSQKHIKAHNSVRNELSFVQVYYQIRVGLQYDNMNYFRFFISIVVYKLLF